MEARLDAKDAQMEQQRKEMMEQQLSAPPPAITQAQLTALQTRIEGLHAAKQLQDDELYALEDLIADFVELGMSVPGHTVTREMIYALPDEDAACKLDKLIGLSAAIVGDAAFARQAKRKFL